MPVQLAIPLGRRLLPACLWRGRGDRREVALTFDDGPDPVATPALVALLDRLGVPATFFWLGTELDRATEAARLVAEAGVGHQVGLHGDAHRPFLGRSDRDLRPALERLRDRVAALTGRDPSAVAHVRPPFGLVGPGQARRLIAWGFTPVLCDVLPGDWAAATDVVVRRTLARVRPGSIVALHDGGPGARRIVAHVEALVPSLRARGLGFATVADLVRP